MVERYNFEELKSFMKFENEGDFYMIRLIKRKTENPDMPKSQRWIKTYYVYSLDDYKKYEDEIKELCYITRSRAYIRLNVRNDEKIGLQLLRRIAQRISEKSYGFKNIYDSVCGEFHNQKPPYWIVDIDEGVAENSYDIIRNAIVMCRPEGKNKLINLIRTVSGYHLITTPFDLKDFRKHITINIDVHKDNPTLLYCKFD